MGFRGPKTRKIAAGSLLRSPRLTGAALGGGQKCAGVISHLLRCADQTGEIAGGAAVRGTAADLQLPGRPLLMWWGEVVPLARGAQREAAHGAPVPLASRTMGLAAIEAPEPDLRAPHGKAGPARQLVPGAAHPRNRCGTGPCCCGDPAPPAPLESLARAPGARRRALFRSAAEFCCGTAGPGRSERTHKPCAEPRWYCSPARPPPY